MSTRLASLLCGLLVALPAAAEVYRWVDAAGRLHFSQSLDQVPPAQRSAAQAGAARAGSGALQTYPQELPAAPAPAVGRRSQGTLRVPFERRDGLMLVTARLNDRVAAPFLVDTGASSVVLPRALAEELGIRVCPDTPRVTVGTANGQIRVPLVQLDAVELGGARVEGLEAMVSDSMELGLLGAAFFNHFVYGVDAALGELTLAPNEGLRGGLDADAWRARFRALREPLAELERYLEEREVSRAGRRAELDARREELRSRLAELDREATQQQVPAAWRQ